MKLLILPVLTVAALAAPKPKVVEPSSPVHITEGSGVKTVAVTDRDVVHVNAKLSFSTLIVLPREERIVHANVGDSQLWVVSAKENMAFVKPTKELLNTNLDLITASGNVYSFVLTEGAATPDIKVFVEVRGDTMLGAINGKPKFVTQEQVADFEEQFKLAKAETERVRKESAAQIESAVRRSDERVAHARAAIPATIKHDYYFADHSDFQVRAMWHDGKFMYIQASPRETPTIFAIDGDGKSNLVQFDYADGTYTVRQLLTRGYLQIGKKRLHFSSRGR